jgi:hypothetical protein
MATAILFRLYQRTKDATEPTLWAEADDPLKFREILQYQMDSALPEGLRDFYIIEYRCASFMPYCENLGIKKRSFDERMGVTTS